MQLYGALVLFITLSAALGLRCYICQGEKCAGTVTCPAGFDRCATLKVGGVVTRSCMNNGSCIRTINCCNQDLCNSALPNGPSSVVLLLVTSAVVTVFL